MKRMRRILLVSAVVAIGSSVASASSIFVDTFTFGPGAGYDYNLTNPIVGTTTFNAVLEKFDDNLLGVGGTLQNIAFQLSVTNLATASATNSITICNGSGCTPGGPLNVLTLGGSVPVAVAGPSGMNTSSTPQATQDFTTPGHAVSNLFSSCVGFSCTINNANIFTVTGLSATTSSSTNVTNSVLAFAPYRTTGSGTFISGLDITVGPAGVVGVGDPGLSYSATSNISGILTVTYTYAPTVPEPATLTLMGTALLGCAFALRRKQNAKR